MAKFQPAKSHPWRSKFKDPAPPKFFFCRPEELSKLEPEFHYRRTALAATMAARELNTKIMPAKKKNRITELKVADESLYIVCQEDADGSIKVI